MTPTTGCEALFVLPDRYGSRIHPFDAENHGRQCGEILAVGLRVCRA